MTTYRYKGQTKDGTAVSGVIRAYDEFEAASRLRETVAVITRLEEVQEKKENIFNRPIGLKIKEKELALICSQFAIILSAGMSIQHCVEMVAAQTRNRHIRQMLEKVAEEVGAGYSMAQSFENNAPYLPKTFIETVRAGEQSGTLEECFQRLHRYYDKSAKTKAKVVSTLTYPAMVIVVAIVVFIIIIAVAVPAFNDVFAEMGTQLPGITRVLLAISDFFIGWWWLLLLIAAGLGIAYMVARRSIRGRRAIAAWSLTKAPLHRLHSLNAAAQFAHSMATMLTAGLPVPKALDVTGNVISNYTFALAVQEVKQKVERGRTISESMGQIEYFPKMLTEMVGVGEQSGSLEETLDVIGEYFDNEVEVTTARLLSVLEPIITIALAVIVVVLLLAVRDLIPVVSYLAAHGRCRYCGAKLSRRHVLSEAVSALVFVTLLLHYDISLQALEGWCVAGILLACSFADLEGYIIPDRFIAVGVVLFITTLFFDPQPLRRALDGAIGGLAVAGGVLLLVLGMEKLLGREAMGGGDIKLLFLTGLFLGWKRNLLCLVAACVIGIVWGLLQKKRDGGEAIPWGPSIALGAWLTALCGQQIIDWYLGLL